MTQAPAGWYPQPDGTQRYWDGSGWTEHVAPGAAPAVLAAPPVPAAPPVLAAPPVPLAAEPPTAPAPQEPAVALVAPPAPIAAPPAPPALADPPVQQAAYAAIPSAAPVAKPRKRVWPWVLGIGGGILLVVIALVAWGIVALVGATKGPGEAVTSLDKAWRSGDCAAMEKVTTADARVSLGWDDCASFEAGTPTELDGLSLHVDSTSIVNDVATVVTTEEWLDGSDPHSGTYTLIKVDGDWAISTATFD